MAVAATRPVRLLLVLVVLAACGGASDSCPTLIEGSSTVIEGGACDVEPAELCFGDNTFSSCASAWYRCEGGRWVFDHGIDANDGASCVESPLTSCSYEGNPGCATLPHARGCACGEDGRWRCGCSCYDGTDCPACPAEPQPGAACGPAGNACSYGGTTCTCTDHGDGTDPTFDCG